MDRVTADKRAERYPIRLWVSVSPIGLMEADHLIIARIIFSG